MFAASDSSPLVGEGWGEGMLKHLRLGVSGSK